MMELNSDSINATYLPKYIDLKNERVGREEPYEDS